MTCPDFPWARADRPHKVPYAEQDSHYLPHSPMSVTSLYGLQCKQSYSAEDMKPEALVSRANNIVK